MIHYDPVFSWPLFKAGLEVTKRLFVNFSVIDVSDIAKSYVNFIYFFKSRSYI